MVDLFLTKGAKKAGPNRRWQAWVHAPQAGALDAALQRRVLGKFASSEDAAAAHDRALIAVHGRKVNGLFDCLLSSALCLSSL